MYHFEVVVLFAFLPDRKPILQLPTLDFPILMSARQSASDVSNATS